MTTGRVISGSAKPGFEAVRDAFVENFERRDELGAACCVYHRGEKVVDLWGGIRNETAGEPWEENTMVIVFSATKGMSGLAMALAQSRGLFDYDERVAAYWPEFAQQGKDRITIRQLLAHRRGFMPSTSWQTETSLPILIGWPLCSRGRNRRGNRERARATTA